MSGWEIYLITRLDALQGAAVLVAIVAGVAFLLCGFFTTLDISGSYTDGDKENVHLRMMRTWTRTLCIVALSATSIAVVTPTSREMAAIIILPKIANSETVQNEAREIYDLAKEWLRNAAGAGAPAKNETPHA